jgi:hypothetical protein
MAGFPVSNVNVDKINTYNVPSVPCPPFSVSAADVEEVVEYIAQQEIHHRVASFQDEFRKLLHAHGIAFDERYVWD